MNCPGPGVCPFASEKRFRWVVFLVALLLVCMTVIALAAVSKGKDGILTASVEAAMSTAVVGVVLGDLRAYRRIVKLSETQPEKKGGE
jgi:hypothetical protein